MSGDLFFLNLETTGLDPAKDKILEIAVWRAPFSRPFDAEEVYHAVLHAVGGDSSTPPIVREMHEKSGLWTECFWAKKLVSDAEYELLQIVPEVTDRDERPILAGSTIHFDRAFLRVHMPRLERRFIHQHYDVSSINLFCQSLGMSKLPKAEAHRAREDVRESIAHAKACAEWLGRLR